MLDNFGAKLRILSLVWRNFIKLAIKIIYMATTKKGMKKTAPKKTSKPKKSNKKNKSGNIFAKILLSVIIVAAIAYIVSLFSDNIKARFSQVKDNEELIVKNTDDNEEKDASATTTPVKKHDNPKQEEEVKKPEVKKEETKKETPKVEQTEPAKKKQTEVIDLKKEFKENQTLSGCWFSTTQGSALTMDEYGYRIDFSGVDASEPITGKYSVEGNQIIFLNDNSGCKGIEGTYRITFDKKNISLDCKDDECKERRNVLETEWEWIEL